MCRLCNLVLAAFKLSFKISSGVEVQSGNRFVKQGSVCNSLFFVCRGWGKVIADVPLSMTQYEAMKARAKPKGKSSSGRKSACYEREQTMTKELDPSRLSPSLSVAGTDKNTDTLP